LLIFSRKQVMQSQPVALNELIRNLTKMLKRVIREDITLACAYQEQLPFVQADPGMLEQVLLNLVVNARDAMAHGGKLVIATENVSLDAAHGRTNPEARSGDFVCLSVNDTGTGIAPEHLPRIFEPFFTTKEPGKGTGLGLATVHGIVKQHQGWVEVASRVDEGTTFKILLPAISTPGLNGVAGRTEADLRGGTETILLAEDDFSVRLITRRVLETLGYKVFEATTAEQALEIGGRHTVEIDLLITDIVMPGMNGRELAQQLKVQKPNLKVICVSGYGAEVVGKDTDFLLRAKSHYLQKPFSASNLARTVRLCLDEGQV
jgi:CheY-like chemotaxis protein